MPASQNIVTASGRLLRMRELFDAASAEQGDLRNRILEAGCQGDSELRAAIELLLSASDEPHPLLDHPLSVAAADSPDAGRLAPGTVLGTYRIVREIGSGGMGVVYLAEQVGESARFRFAVKVMRWCSPQLFRRFQWEQAILRGLSHANIAHLVEAGITAGHSPYLVMEYVDGQPILDYAARQNLPVEARLGLFRQLCAAVAYLHRNLVIHRDLKPSNVLVTADGVVKLVDFGIAKLLEADGSVPTQTRTMALTPEYASPEQVRGSLVSTLSDVYSLGVLLYELLTGTRPFQLSGTDALGMLRKICEEEPAKPSAAVSVGQFETAGRRRLARKLRGELDTIVLKALRKEPERRYSSVEQFDHDVRSYLEGLPVLAQGDSVWYRTRKFAARQRVGVGFSLAALTLLFAGIIATTTEAGIARRERARAEAQAAEAERARAMAQQQAARAQAEQARAERETREAQQQRANAERRLEQLSRLAHDVARTYASSAGENKPEQIAALFPENVIRDLLLGLQRERALDPPLTDLLDRTTAQAESDELTTVPTWRVPAGWSAQETESGEYRVGIDQHMIYQGKPSLFIRSLVAEPEGAVLVWQEFSARRFQGKRVRLSVFLRPEKLDTQAHLWLGVDSPQALDQALISGTATWTKKEIVIDVPPDAASIQFGLTAFGTGTLWASPFRFEAVELSVPLTAPKGPRNLNFSK